MRHREHPDPKALLRFLSGEVSRAESRAIVRHLLSGCRECVAVTRPLWLLADSLTQAVLADRAARRGATG